MAKHSRSRDEWGSIQYAYDGNKNHHRIRYWGKDPKTGAYRRMSKTVRGTKRQAQKERARLRVEHSGEAPCPTVGQVWEEWYLPAQKLRIENGDLSESSLVQWASGWKRHVAPRWADEPCENVRPLAVQQWITGSGMTLSQARNACSVLSQLMAIAVRYEVMAYNPMTAKYVMPSASTVAERDKYVWGLDDLGRVWAALRGSWIEPAFLLAAFGSCRTGEAMGPTGGDVKLVHVEGVPVAIVNVDKQVTQYGKVTTRLKNRWSKRPVVVPGKAALRLAEVAGEVEDGFLTNNGIGEPSSQKLLLAEWAKTLNSVGLEVHPFRNLRNSWQTNSRWSLGIPPWLTERMMGHVGEGVTGAHYDRPVEEQFAEALAEAYSKRPYDRDWNFLP